jgi:hypothetical protein
MQLDNTNILAQKIARILEADNARPDLAAIHASIEKINQRLDRIEINLEPSALIHSSPAIDHPSIDRFAIAEAIADEIFGKLQKEKACTFEPNGKPCDHCAMCSSRGF